jgi:hypothetical protein
MSWPNQLAITGSGWDPELLRLELGELTDAVKPDAPRLWDNAPDNLCADIEVGDEAATTQAFRCAAHIVRLDSWVQHLR